MNKISLFLLFAAAPASFNLPAAMAQDETTVPANAVVQAGAAEGLLKSGLAVDSAELIGKADVIVRGAMRTGATREGATYYRITPHTKWRNGLKGTESMRSNQFYLPEGTTLSFGEREDVIVFARTDFEKRRNEVIEAFRVKDLGVEADAITARIRDAVAKSVKIDVEMKLDKPQYAAGEPFTWIWQVKNISQGPAVVYIGPYAFRATYIADGRAHGGGIGDPAQRTAADYKTLAPGEVYEFRHTAKALVPEGKLGVRMSYVVDNNEVYDGGTRTGRSMPDVVFFEKETEVEVPIGPPAPALVAAALPKLASPVWKEVRDAAELVSLGKTSAAAPAMRALAKHPWGEVRILAAQALVVEDQPISPEVRDLLFDRERLVRYRTRELVRNRRVLDSGLALLALREVIQDAIEKGYFSADRIDDVQRLNFDLARSKDPRIGDILMELMKTGRESGYVAANVAGNYFKVRVRSDAVANDEQKAAIAEAWAAKRGAVQQPHTMADLKAAMDHCRKIGFNDFKFDPRLSQIREQLKMLLRAPYRPADAEALVAMGPEIVPTTLFLVNNDPEGRASLGLYEAYRQWKAKEAVDFLLGLGVQGNDHALQAATEIDAAKVRAAYRP